jgi:Disulphide bond corrector protein DsbC
MPALTLLGAASWHSSIAQTSPALNIAPSAPVAIKRGGEADLRLKAEVRPGFHVNSNTPADEFLIPLKLTWPKQAIEAGAVTFPKPQLEKYAFSEKPVSVFSGNFEIVTRFKAPADAQPGAVPITGKLRFQACNEKECLAPRTIDVRVTLNVQ